MKEQLERIAIELSSIWFLLFLIAVEGCLVLGKL